MDGRFITIKQLAERWKVPLSWLYERSRHDALPGQIRLGRYLRFSEAAVEAFEKGKLRDAETVE